MEIIIVSVDILRRILQRMGPYLLVEVLLPGGTLIALLLFWYRRRRLEVHEKSATAAFAGAGMVAVMERGDPNRA